MTQPHPLAGRSFTSRLDKRGRTVVPKEIREHLGVPCRITFDVLDNGTARVRVVSSETESSDTGGSETDNTATPE